MDTARAFRLRFPAVDDDNTRIFFEHHTKEGAFDMAAIDYDENHDKNVRAATKIPILKDHKYTEENIRSLKKVNDWQGF